jgi:hypothetical protein
MIDVEDICCNIGMGDSGKELQAKQETIKYCRDILADQNGLTEGVIKIIASSYYDGYLKALQRE